LIAYILCQNEEKNLFVESVKNALPGNIKTVRQEFASVAITNTSGRKDRRWDN